MRWHIKPTRLSRQWITLELLAVGIITVVPSAYWMLWGEVASLPVSTGDHGFSWIVDAGTIVLIIYLLGRDGRNIRDIGLRGNWLREIGLGAAIAPLVLVVGYICYACVAYILAGEHRERPGETVWTNLLGVTLLLGAAAEELLYRCYLWLRLMDMGLRPWMAVGITNGISALLHGFDAAGTVAAFVSGVVWSSVYMRWGGLLRVIGAHWLDNIARVMLTAR